MLTDVLLSISARLPLGSAFLHYNIDVVRIDQIGYGPAVEIVFRHALLSKTLVFGGLPEHVGCHQDFETNALVIAKVITLIEFMPTAELAAHRVPQQLHELDTVEGTVTIRTTYELIEIFADFRHLKINRV